MLNFNKFFGAPKEEPPVETPEEAKAPAEEDATPSETAEPTESAETEAAAAAGEAAENAEAAPEEPPVDEHDAEANNPGAFPVGEPLTGDFANFFSGKTYLNHLVPKAASVLNMTFEPGCRSSWHIHHNGGQFLLVTGGAGWYQEEGREARPLRPGDIVKVPAEIKHWHGAAKDSWFSHLLVPVPVPGSSNAFLEEVDDKDYDALPPSREESDGSPFGGIAKLFGKEK